METIKELRTKVQAGKLAGNPYLQRWPSIYLTALFIRTPFTPNQITILMLLAGLASGIVAALGFVWLAFFLIYTSLLLDMCDGEVARYRKVFSMRGIYIDLYHHLLTQGVFFLGLSLWVAGFPVITNIPVFVLGVIGAFAILSRRAGGAFHRILYANDYLRYPERYPIPAPKLPDSVPASASGKRSKYRIHTLIFFLAHRVQDILLMTVILFFIFVLDHVFFPQNHLMLTGTLVTYAVLFIVYVVHETISGYYGLERNIAVFRDGLTSEESEDD